ncbi:MAG: hypothetical protein ACUVQ8_03655 [Nitrososphaeria archaeon]
MMPPTENRENRRNHYGDAEGIENRINLLDVEDVKKLNIKDYDYYNNSYRNDYQYLNYCDNHGNYRGDACRVST